MGLGNHVKWDQEGENNHGETRLRGLGVMVWMCRERWVRLPVEVSAGGKRGVVEPNTDQLRVNSSRPPARKKQTSPATRYPIPIAYSHSFNTPSMQHIHPGAMKPFHSISRDVAD